VQRHHHIRKLFKRARELVPFCVDRGVCLGHEATSLECVRLGETYSYYGGAFLAT
jgi:hypothetical protein